MTGQTKLGLLFHKKLLFTGTMGDMADATVHCRHRGMDMFAGLNHLGNTLMTGEADLTFGLPQDKGVITGMGGMAGLASPFNKGWVAMFLGLLLAGSLVAGQTEFALVCGCY